jgi:hypothetical protein
MHVFFKLAFSLYSGLSSSVINGSRYDYPRDIGTKIPFKNIVIFGDSFTDNGLSFRVVFPHCLISTSLV